MSAIATDLHLKFQLIDIPTAIGAIDLNGMTWLKFAAF
jgi:hypothetical protein